MTEFKDVIAAFDKHLHAMGFRKNRRIWRRQKGEIWQYLGLGRSRFSKHFSLDIGVYIGALDTANKREIKIPLRHMHDCHLIGTAYLMVQEFGGLEKWERFDKLADFEDIEISELERNIDEYLTFLITYEIFELLDEVSTYQGIASFIQGKRQKMGTFLVRYYYHHEVVNFCLSRIEAA